MGYSRFTRPTQGYLKATLTNGIDDEVCTPAQPPFVHGACRMSSDRLVPGSVSTPACRRPPCCMPAARVRMSPAATVERGCPTADSTGAPIGKRLLRIALAAGIQGTVSDAALAVADRAIVLATARQRALSTSAQKLALRLCCARILASKASGGSSGMSAAHLSATACSRDQYRAP